MNSKSYFRYNSVVFAPLPPPPGGIGSINQLLRSNLDNKNIGFFEPINKMRYFHFPLLINILNLFLLVRSILSTHRYGNILFFSSEGLSFYEKVIWIIFALIFKRRPIVFMVSGLFPRAWNSSPNILSRSSTLVNRPSVTILSQSSSWKRY